MTEPKYYPLVGINSETNDKFPMFPVTDRAVVLENGKPFLCEIIPGYFRVENRNQHPIDSILCPRCGKKMRCINSMSRSAHLYHCGCLD